MKGLSLNWNKMAYILNILKDFLSIREQRAILNGHVFILISVNEEILLESILGTLLFLIYIIYLTVYCLMSNYLLMTHLCFLNKNLKKISDWAFQWKTIFNNDASKQAQEVIFIRKIKEATHAPLVFSNAIVS